MDPAKYNIDPAKYKIHPRNSYVIYSKNIINYVYINYLLFAICYLLFANHKISKSLTCQYSIPPLGNGRLIIKGIFFCSNSSMAI